MGKNKGSNKGGQSSAQSVKGSTDPQGNQGKQDAAKKGSTSKQAAGTVEQYE